MFLSENVIFRGVRLSLGHFVHQGSESPVCQLQNGVSTSPLPPFIVDLLTFKDYQVYPTKLDPTGLDRVLMSRLRSVALLAAEGDGGLWRLESTQFEPRCLSADNGPAAEVIMGKDQVGKAIGGRHLAENPTTCVFSENRDFHPVQIQGECFFMELPFCLCRWLAVVGRSICLVKVLLTDGRPEACP